eukprot:3561023-Amphidinium_carterae.1
MRFFVVIGDSNASAPTETEHHREPLHSLLKEFTNLRFCSLHLRHEVVLTLPACPTAAKDTEHARTLCLTPFQNSLLHPAPNYSKRPKERFNAYSFFALFLPTWYALTIFIAS